MAIERLLELHELAKREGRRYARKRCLYDQLARSQGRHHIGIVGARGTGKTVLLRQYALEHEDVFYLSADTLEPDDDPWDLIRKLNRQYGFTTFLLDEVHFLPDATGLLKRLYDFLDVRILFSSSVALAMRASAHDLSRRVRLLELHGFSFREYLAFTQDISLPLLDLAQVAAGDQIFPAGTNVLREPKVLMAPPIRLLYRDWEDAVGGLREDFFAEAMKQAGIRFQYLKSTRGAKTPDFLIEDAPTKLVVEIGGRGKGREQFKGVKIDHKLVFAHRLEPEKHRLPLVLLGYLR